ncbi:putative WRKY transcription factor 47 [Senna tora]|uniref:Putative WRKY transcription factor 47 n=1 Tax=Senna tora TaxID=362788 RepID=A0A834SMA0_9FABA|nr:putative WRKY transcription factor 47 [Senna tora]
MQKVEAKGIMRWGEELLMDPRGSPNLEMNNASDCDDKSVSVAAASASSKNNKAEVIKSKQRDHDLSGKRACGEDANLDRSSQLAEPHQLLPFRKARVSVRARSEAPLAAVHDGSTSYLSLRSQWSIKHLSSLTSSSRQPLIFKIEDRRVIFLCRAAREKKSLRGCRRPWL